MHFLALPFVLLSITIHEANHFHQVFLQSFSEFFPTAVFSCFNCLFDNLACNLLYSTIYIIHKTCAVPLESCSIVSFDFSKTAHTCKLILNIPKNSVC